MLPDIEFIKARFPEEFEYISSLSAQLLNAGTKGALAGLLANEAGDFSMFELQMIGGGIAREVSKLPHPYREKVQPYLHDQLFGVYHRMLSMQREGSFTVMNGPLRDPETFKEFCRMLAVGCFCWDDSHKKYPHLTGARNALFYYLVCAFAMFVLEEPGHPVGTPFPGGFAVEKRKEDYFCPIRDKEEDVPYSICNFCPAKQSDVP